jgi:hypothetical protein
MNIEFTQRLAKARAAIVPDTPLGAAELEGLGVGTIARRRLLLFCYWLAKVRRAWDDPELDLRDFAQALRGMQFPERLIVEYVCTVKDRLDQMHFSQCV